MTDDREISGYRSIVHYSLLVVPRLRGVPYMPAVMNIMGTMILSLMWQTLGFIPIAVLVHIGLKYLTQDDPHAVTKLIRSWRQPDYLPARGTRRYKGQKQLGESIYAR